ncbi:MAG: serine/threonine protein kinase, partial [Gemmataceae bacterium]|nr:serine/threonine protein kinase [Gemmataceae bacterium]
MSVFLRLSSLAMRGLVSGACEHAGLGEGGAHAVTRVVALLAERFSDQSQRLERALRESSRRAWRALEMALQADTLLNRLSGLFVGAEDKAFAAQVKAFLDAAPLPQVDRSDFRPQCLKELAAARTRFLAGKYDAQELARHTGNFSRFGDQAPALEAEWAVCAALAEEVRRDGFDALHWLLSQRPGKGMPLLVMAARFFFRRAVEEDAELHRGLTFAKLEAIASAQQAGFQALEQAFRAGEAKLDGVLGGVLSLNESVQGVDAKLDALRAEILGKLGSLSMAREVRQAHSFSIRDDREKALVRALMERWRALPESQRNDFPALLHGLAKLGFASGDFKEAGTGFRRVALLVGDPVAAAEARHNAYLAALGAGDHEGALAELREAVRLDGRRWMPFPFDKYAPERILGAGGFGTAFLCRHQWMGGPVVVKALSSADGFAEAQLLRRLDHPGIIRITDAEGGERPYLVMDFFDGKDLSKLAPLPIEDAVQVGRKMAEALKEAHERGILHRDVKPGNVLARKEREWTVKVIDFGLAVDVERDGIAGTLDYAAPEQLGRLPGAKAGPASDVYGWGRTMCFALFGTPSPHFRQWGQIPREVADLLGDCVEERPEKRPRGFGEVLSRLGAAPASWSATVEEFCEETRRFWLSGRASGFAPDYQRIARMQPAAEFVRDIRGLAAMLERFGFVRGEALVGMGDTMCLTNYRMAVTLPGGRLLVVPLHELESYEF